MIENKFWFERSALFDHNLSLSQILSLLIMILISLQLKSKFIHWPALNSRFESWPYLCWLFLRLLGSEGEDKDSQRERQIDDQRPFDLQAEE